MFLLSVLLFLATPIFFGLVFDRKLPYFPIEISRILASGPYALWSFRLALFIFPVVHVPNHGWWLVITSFLVLGITIFDDVNHYKLHLTNVIVVLVFVAYRVLITRPEQLFLVVFAFLLYFARVILLVIVVGVYEFDNPDWYRIGSWCGPRESRRNHIDALQQLWSLKMKIAYGHHKPRHQRIMLVFRFAGLMQWTVFILMALALK